MFALACLSILFLVDAEAAPPRHAHGDHARATHRFEDAERWAEVWDDPERDEWQRPADVIAWMDVEPGMTVADIGAGTGYFNAHLSRAVGETGTVYAVDVESTLVAYMTERAKREKTPNVRAVLGRHADPGIPPGPVDRILLVDTYHHIGDRRAYFARLRERLGREGRLVNVDWKPGDLPMGPGPEHKMHPEEVVAELSAVGFVLEDEYDLPYQYVQVFGTGR